MAKLGTLLLMLIAVAGVTLLLMTVNAYFQWRRHMKSNAEWAEHQVAEQAREPGALKTVRSPLPVPSRPALAEGRKA